MKKTLCSTIFLLDLKLHTDLHDNSQLSHGIQALSVGFFHLEIRNTNLQPRGLSGIDRRIFLDNIVSPTVPPNYSMRMVFEHSQLIPCLIESVHILPANWDFLKTFSIMKLEFT